MADVHRLNLAERRGLAAALLAVQQAQQEISAMLVELGLDPDGQYELTDAGLVARDSQNGAAEAAEEGRGDPKCR